jgi:predicted permease
MNPIRTICRYLRSLIHRRDVKHDIDAEMRFHIEQRTEENIAAGMTQDEAAREACKRFGNIQSVREECRDIRRANLGESFLQDIRFGLRMLGKNPGFSAVSFATLALGVGATTAIYSVVNVVILNPIPGPEPERVIQIAERNYPHGLYKDQNQVSLYGVCPVVLEALLPHQSLFSNFSWYDTIWLDRKMEDFTEGIQCDTVPATFFKLWKVPPLLGRTFAPDEAVPLNGNKMPIRDSVMVLSYSMWRSHFGGDPSIIGRVLQMSGLHFTVVGVMPQWFAPDGAYDVCWTPTEPAHIPADQGGSLPNTRVRARLAPGTRLAQAQAMLDSVAAQLRAAHVDDFLGQQWKEQPHGLELTATPLQAQFQGSYGSEDLRRTLFGLLGAVCFVLLIVCANIANLTLARTERRQQELAIRSSIGAGRWRLMRQLLTKCVLLACLGGVAGIVVTVVAMKLLVAVVPSSMPRLRPVELDGHVLAWTLLISVATGLLFGLMPAWRAGRVHLIDTLKQAGAGATAGLHHKRSRGALVVAEVALAVVLMAGAGLMIKSVVRLLHVNPGFDPENLIQISLSLPWQKYGDSSNGPGLRKLLFGQLSQDILTLPGVKAVGLGKHSAWPGKAGLQGTKPSVEVGCEGCGVGTGDLFKAMRIVMLEGRPFEERDRGPNARTAIINQTLGRALWPGENALGKKFTHTSLQGQDETYQVIGVVADSRDESYTEQIRPAFYRPCDELDFIGRPPFLVIRTTSDPRALIPAIRKELKAAEPDMGSPGFTISQQQLYDSTQAQRTYMTYLVIFAAVGVLLCAIGIYGVLAYSVAQRIREIGIRIAIGAQRGDVLWMVMMEGLRLVVIGAGVGLLAAYWLTRLLQNQLFEVNPADPTVMAAVILFLFAVALLACYLPALRAARTNPMTALRYE